MLCYEIVNPSDAATMLAPDREVALAALAFIGEGAYAGRVIARDLRSIGDDEAEPLAVPMFFGDTYDAWWKAAGYTDEPIDTVLRTRKGELVTALRSVAYGSLEDRRTYESAISAITDPDKLAAFKREWEDRRRSSLNAIAKRAWAWADHIERATARGAANGEAA